VTAIVAAAGPAIAWTVFGFAVVAVTLLASLTWDAARNRARRNHRPSWARWRRTRHAYRTIRYRAACARLYWGI
jgi:O-antigen/teichoic acid export membrane protein